MDDVEPASLSPEECTEALIKTLSENHILDDQKTRLCLSYIKGGADMSYPGPYTETPLMMAVRSGNIAIVRAMVDRGANVNKYGSEAIKTPLNIAASEDNMNIVQFLVAHGADVNIITTDGGGTALMFAAMHGNTEMAKFLIDNGADADWRSAYGTAEEWAFQRGHPHTAKAIAKAKKKRQPSRRIEIGSNPSEYFNRSL
jgi:ankyrin repeat protein